VVKNHYWNVFKSKDLIKVISIYCFTTAPSPISSISADTNSIFTNCG
jgi:hypothetical protein